MRTLLAALLLCASGLANAAGPTEIAQGDTSLWPYTLDGRAAFDRASRAELLVSAVVLADLMSNPPAAEMLRVRKVNEDSVARWLAMTRQRWLANLISATDSCSDVIPGCGFDDSSWDALVEYGRTYIGILAGDTDYQAWLASSQTFYATYFHEQWRLAALFPEVSSEILTFDDTEVTGDELADGQFMLSFDDGPSGRGGNTDKYITLLEEEAVSAFFFVLGEALQQRLRTTDSSELAALYQNQCLASHGMEHKQHPRWVDWQRSIDQTAELIETVYPDQPVIPFRPPYGQRTPEISAYVNATDGRVILWNIDSQDWNRRIEAAAMAERVKKLMLVKRRGMLLFHDIQPKALSVLPEIIHFARQSELVWLDCSMLH